ncbi:hypothetical protein K435DRAFT_261279 [Dendrothele bispora CBS 962.96]|uniref:Uncharacterized protein n=1 Tax=Dendrothele bispora (strain CBS 962.96) TaxID=1314807 RepID=A0A4S8MW70_DENBC|nr:hypothetical protein K435DRAFT_261279 [Dendrothele bispora CBS 962.96]
METMPTSYPSVPRLGVVLLPPAEAQGCTSSILTAIAMCIPLKIPSLAEILSQDLGRLYCGQSATYARFCDGAHGLFR